MDPGSFTPRTRLRPGLLAALLLAVTVGILAPAPPCHAWLGLELDARGVSLADPYETAGGDGGLWDLSARIMYQETWGPADAEIHWLAEAVGTYGDLGSPRPPADDPFRILDLEAVHREGERTLLTSEIDRLSLTLSAGALRMTVGRQAVTWGEAYYYNIGDLFGAFPVTETNRLHKPGIDGLYISAGLGTFSDAALMAVPSEDGDDSIALRLLLPLGSGALSLTGGAILDTDRGGVGYTVDLEGTKLYGTWLLVREDGGEDFTQLVLGAERQVGPYTHVVGEVYRNGWGATDPDLYPALILSDRYLSGEALTLGRWSAVVQVSRQMTPLTTITPAVFANLSDGSSLLRMDGSYSLSDLTDLTAGVFLGLGRRPGPSDVGSEFGAAPVSLYIEVVHNL